MSELEDRRQRAREAAWDKARPDDHTEIPDVDEAIEVATRVKITREMVQVLANGGASDVQDLRDIFAAAGFEVIE